MSAISLKMRASSALVTTGSGERDTALGRGMPVILRACKRPDPSSGSGPLLRDWRALGPAGAECAEHAGSQRAPVAALDDRGCVRVAARLAKDLFLLQRGEQTEVTGSSAHGGDLQFNASPSFGLDA